MKKDFFNIKNFKEILIIVFASVFVCIPLLSQQIDISYDDGIQHIARLIGTETSIKEGQTAIMSDFCNGFGYSWNLFYSPLTAYIPLIFRIIGCSYINCIKLFIFLVTLLSGITMYFFTKSITKNNKIAVLSSIIYIFAPYRFTDMYIRNALAELTSFIFIPMVFQGLYGVLKQKKNSELILIIGSCLLFLTHTIILMYTAIICFIYVLTQINKLKIRKVRSKLIYSAILIVIITSFFWMPLLQLKNSANYEVFKPGRMERTDVLIAFKLSFDELFFTKQTSNMIYEIGIINILALIISPLIIKKLKNKYKSTDLYRFYIFSLIVTIILFIMTLDIFPFEILPSTLKMIQFTFRLLEFTSFFVSFIVAFNIYKLINNLKLKHILLILIAFMILSLFYTGHLYYTNNLNENWLIPAVPVTENTGRVHAGCASFEYLPSKAFENRNYIETRSKDVVIINGEAQIDSMKIEGIRMSLTIKCENEVELELPYIYYPGYEVIVESTNQKIDTFETEKGFVGIRVSNLNNEKVNIKYTGTILMKISKIISIIGTIVLVGIVVIKRR